MFYDKAEKEQLDDSLSENGRRRYGGNDLKTVLKRALCGITAFVVAAGAMSYFPADTFAGIARGVTAYAENETWRRTITAAATIKGDGSEKSPYEINTAEDLLAVMKKAKRNMQY